jgi:tRNA 2-thiouridine synthesizing protein E
MPGRKQLPGQTSKKRGCVITLFHGGGHLIPDRKKGNVMDTNTGSNSNTEQKMHCDDFLSDITFWTTDIAEKLAKESHVAEYGLTEKHWEVILYVRDFYLKYGRGPEAVKVAKKCGLTMDEMCDLFPCGLVRGAYKIAGLPRPHGCI